MKYDFWLELPKALVNLLENQATQEEMSLCYTYEKAAKVKIKFFNYLGNKIDNGQYSKFWKK